MKRSKFLAVALALTLVVSLTACAPQKPPPAAPLALAVPPEPAQAAPAPKAPTKEAWELEWERALNGARREGKVVVLSTAGTAVRDALLLGFKEKYQIGVEFISGRGGEVAEKLMSERRAGLYLADVYIGGSTTVLAVLKPAGAVESVAPLLLLPEVLDSKVWLGGGLYYADKERTLLAFITYNAPPITINQNVVKAAEEPRSYFDLLDPKWKGRIAMFDPVGAGIGLNQASCIMEGVLPPLGIDYLRQLAKQEPVITGDHRLLGEWLARGKYAIAITLRSDVTASFIKAGVPLKEIIPVEGAHTSAGSGNLALINRPAHPNAAKVFVNWLLTKEGQYLFSKAMDFPSARLDVPTDHLDPIKVVNPKGKWYMSDNEEFRLKQPIYAKTIAEIFGPAAK